MHSSTIRGMRDFAVGMAVLMALTVPVGRASEQAVKLYPFVYFSQSAEGTDVEALCSLFGYHANIEGSSGRVFPVFWGDDYFHIVPVFWSNRGNWVLVPLGGQWDVTKTVGPLWWGPGTFVVCPVFWKKHENWFLLPVAGKLQHFSFLGPAIWGSDFFHVFPVLWTWGKARSWLLLPIGGRLGCHTLVGPVWSGPDSFTVFPVFWWRKKSGSWVLFPIAGKTKHHTLVGPVLFGDGDFFIVPVLFADRNGWSFMFGLAGGEKGRGRIGTVWWSMSPHGKSSFGVFPVFWKNEDSFFLFPFFSIQDDNKVIGPVWWGNTHFYVIPLWFRRGIQSHKTTTIIPPLLGRLQSDKYAEKSSASFLIRLVHWERHRGGYRFEFQPFLDIAGGDAHHFGFVWRLFEYHRDADERYWRILFLPHKFHLR